MIVKATFRNQWVAKHFTKEKKGVYKCAVCFQTLSPSQVKKRNKDITQIKTHQLLEHFHTAHQNIFWKTLPLLKSDILFGLNI